MKKIKNRKIIQELFKIKNILKKAGEKKIFLEQGLTVANYEILKIIKEEKTETISDIQNILLESLPSLTQKTNKLEELNFLKKKKDDNDPRKNILYITKKGEISLKRIEKKIEIISSLIFLDYSEKEKKCFLEMLMDVEKKISHKIKI